MAEWTYEQLLEEAESLLQKMHPEIDANPALIAIGYILLAKEKREAAQSETTSAKAGKEWYRVLGSNPRKEE